MIDCETETPNELRQILHIGPHALYADLSAAQGGHARRRARTISSTPRSLPAKR